MKQLLCPISSLRLNNSVVRLTGFMMALMIALSVLTGESVFIFAIVIDYFVRAVTPANYSPFSWLATKIVGLVGLGYHPIDKAPKIFAARVGLLFAATAAALHFVNPMASSIVACSLMLFALLESLFDFCLGCVVYTYVVLPIFAQD